ncbi:expressed unknown protein [Seminavis robusta]|uniref:Uncharacterized protein n=1 Tax=Seminavis robusta TaxID=568900 RepID=A0A9N8EKA4_9STRA|nr:expressed unknown protein [Seminavis robusta]|eukprot:Sro1139_g245420.1 n/a (179) ;mRNA; f:10263-10799
MPSRVRFGSTTAVGEGACASDDDLWFHSGTLQERFSSELEAAERQFVLTKSIETDWRGLEYHMKVNAKRPKFAALYVQAVVQKSLALRSAAYRGKRINVEKSLRQFASQHAHANSIMAAQVAKLDQQEALKVHNAHKQSKPSTATIASTPESPCTHRRRPLPTRTVSREGTRFAIIPV